MGHLCIATRASRMGGSPRASGWTRPAFAPLLALALLFVGEALAAPITLSLTDEGGGGDCEARSACTIVNPAYEESGNNGEMPSRIVIDGLYEAIPQSLFAQTGVTSLTITFDAEPLISVVPQTPSTFVFELSLAFDDPSATAVHQLAQPVGLGFEYAAGHWPTPLPSPALLGYLDETRNPPEWVAEGSLSRCGPASSGGDLLCGTTDHLSYFSVLPVPEPGTGLLTMLGLTGLGAGRRRR